MMTVPYRVLSTRAGSSTSRRRTMTALAIGGLSLAIASASASAASGLPAFPASAFRPSTVNQANAVDIRGTWNMPGSGYILDIDREHMVAYSYAGGLCWQDPALLVLLGDGKTVPYYAQSRRPVDTAFAADLYPGGTDQLHAERLGSVPSVCTRATDRSTSLYTFDAITSTLVDFYPFGSERQIDWAKRKALLRPRAAAARNDAELKGVLTDLLAGFEDAHTAIIGSVGDESFILGSEAKPTGHRLMARARRDNATLFSDWFLNWRKDQQQRVFATLNPATRHMALKDDAVMWGVLDGNVGYLSIESMEGYEADSGFGRDLELMRLTLDKALNDLKGTKALVLDISNNSGGYGQVGLDIAGRFADRRRLAFTVRIPGAYRVAPQSFQVSPEGQGRYLKPVFVLTSEETVSAGEWLALGMRVLPRTVQIGQATQGALTGDFMKGLPNGWILSTSNAVLRDPHGIGYEVTGLPPDIALEVYPGDPSVSDAEFDNGRLNAVLRVAQRAAVLRAPE
ncbi:peptidase S41-like protein [Luteibacter rhizovicinus]|uniref:Peptidase S41-like protein n=1 Tax=Luteibacter rhizovicinus TaxID=242606 RepID=A0A4R3YKW9_9GAMM|nr:S41 family peptidase [Luteibacter rhizovicinus]TCV93405.1 peptidase S41-like protein [Luteibacter rhizovicinus]